MEKNDRLRTEIGSREDKNWRDRTGDETNWGNRAAYNKNRRDLCRDGKPWRNTTGDDKDGRSTTRDDRDRRSTHRDYKDRRSTTRDDKEHRDDMDWRSTFRDDKDLRSTARDDKDGRSTHCDDKDWRSTARDDKDGRSTHRDAKDWRSTSREDKDWRSTSRDAKDWPSTARDAKDWRSTARNDKDGRSIPRNDKDWRSTARDDKDGRSIPRNDKDWRSTARDAKDRPSIPRNDKDWRSTARDAKDWRSTARDDKDGRSTHRDDKDWRSTSRNYKDWRSTARDDKDLRSTAREAEDWRSTARDSEDWRNTTPPDKKGREEPCNAEAWQKRPYHRDDWRKPTDEKRTEPFVLDAIKELSIGNKRSFSHLDADRADRRSSKTERDQAVTSTQYYDSAMVARTAANRKDGLVVCATDSAAKVALSLDSGQADVCRRHANFAVCYRPVKPFPLDRVLLLDDANQMILTLDSRLEAFSAFLDGILSAEQVNGVLQVVRKVLTQTTGTAAESAWTVLQAVYDSRLLGTGLATLVSRCMEEVVEAEEDTAGEALQRLELVQAVLWDLCAKRPSWASKILLPVMAVSGQPRLMSHLQETRPALERGWRDLTELCGDHLAMLKLQHHQLSDRRTRSGRQSALSDDDLAPPNDFERLSIFPDVEDLDFNVKPFLRANKSEGKFVNVFHYLDVNFRLLREDYVRPLRTGIREYKELREKGQRVGKLSDIRIYQSVQVIGAVCKSSLEHLLMFDASRLQKVNWAASKRFMYGTLLCLTVDDFETSLYFATVTDRKPSLLQRGIVQVRFETDLEAAMECRSHERFTMAEATGAFYEAYRHVLKGLHELGLSGTVPFGRYIVQIWHRKAVLHLQHQINAAFQSRQPTHELLQKMQQAQNQILPDKFLKPYVNKGLYLGLASKITGGNPKYRLKTWLGLSGLRPEEEFCRVQEILFPLNEEHDDNIDDDDDEGKDEEVDEEQIRRKLDDDDEIFSKKKNFHPALKTNNAANDNDHNNDDDKDNGTTMTLTMEQLHGRRDNHHSQLEGGNGQGRRTAPPGDGGEGSGAGGVSSDGDWTLVQRKQHHQKQQQHRRLLRLVQTSRPMSRDEAAAVGNLWDPQLAERDRVRLYLYWVHQYQDELRRELKEYGLKYDDASQELQKLRMLEDRSVLQNAAVIGMTTTGAARYRSVLIDVACPIVIIEEAAEVLEAHVVTSLHKDCQHLILIGDHQQLRPSPTVYELCRRYHLDLSLFERLINNGLPHATLAMQHRMRPEIARLVRHVYPDLEDHPVTQGRDHIRGMTSDVFFFSHQVTETQHLETSSKSNQHEADLCVRLCRYLIQQGYGASAITILVAYTGQLLLIHGLIATDKKFFEGVRVTSVDNYQGEENDVIILSLVRSNDEGKVGFLSTDNRVCVALSRARNGFYAFGNFQLLSEKSVLWRKVVKTAKSHGQYGTELVLRCENHPQTEVKATKAKDFDRVPEGGCQLPCKSPLEGCSHLCTLLCHGYDKDHKMYRCMQPCERIVCFQQHRCPRNCYEAWGKCMHLVQRTVPKCGHTQTMPCSSLAKQWSCREPCEVRLAACGHRCSNPCGECRRRVPPQHVKECPVKVERLWTCGHIVTSTCSVPAGALPCRHPCDVILDCGHPCGGTCGQCWGGRVHVACRARCDKPREGCGHACRSPCGALCLPCPEQCPETCQHRPACPLPCGIPCPPCSQRCVWSCQHRPCRSSCSEPCPPCDQPCEEAPLRPSLSRSLRRDVRVPAV